MLLDIITMLFLILNFMSHIERKLREKETVRNSILEAAKNIAAKEGWQSVTIRKIADAIEYTPPIVYEHFENKEDLIRELIYSGFKILGIEFKKIIDVEKRPKTLLRKLSLLHWDFANNNRELYQLMFNIMEKPSPNKEIFENIKMINSIFYSITNNDTLLASELVFNWICLMNGTISILIFSPPPPEILDMAPEVVFGNIMARFIDSIIK
jgi:AcrR family transcriptional regulator